MTYFLKELMFSLVGRRTTYRIGRALYQKARGDVHHDMESNGEMLVQHCVVGAWKRGDMSGQRLVVFDVGANVGDWSSALLDLLTDANMREAVDIYAFEPVPSTFEYLRNRLGTQNTVLHYEQLGLSSENGDGVIYVSGGANAGTNSLHTDSLWGDEKQITIVRATATEFCKTHEIQKVHLLKCDTEGHDMEVIRGALQLLADESISVLQFEYNHRWISSRNFLKDAFTAIEMMPYKLAKIQPHQLLIFSDWHPELERFFHGNYALIHVDALDWFPTQLVSWDRYNAMSV